MSTGLSCCIGKILCGVFLTALALAPSHGSPVDPAANPPGSTALALIVLDASGSMTERIKGETKIEIAKRAVCELVQSLPDDTRLGLVVYGHRKPNDCDDIELLIPPAKLDRAAFIAAVKAIRPKGLTPLSGALEFAARSMDFQKQPATVILVSDGSRDVRPGPVCDSRPVEGGRRPFFRAYRGLRPLAEGGKVHSVHRDRHGRNVSFRPMMPPP